MRNQSALALAATALFIVACGSSVASPPASVGPSRPPGTNPPPSATTPPQPSIAPSPAPTPAGTVSSAAQAAALVFASDPRWAEMLALQPDLIGASRWYEASPDVNGGFLVTITAGSGDCMAGCINQRRFIYHVDPDGTIDPVREEGDEVELDTPTPGTGPARAIVTLTAGPVCPVEQVPPDPNCAPRPVVNATVSLYAADGTEIESTTSTAEGVVAFEVEPGAYYVVAHPVEGLMGTPEPQAFAVIAGSQAGMTMAYDTGIR